jgi:hypothetical protein
MLKLKLPLPRALLVEEARLLRARLGGQLAVDDAAAQRRARLDAPPNAEDVVLAEGHNAVAGLRRLRTGACVDSACEKQAPVMN